MDLYYRPSDRGLHRRRTPSQIEMELDGDSNPGLDWSFKGQPQIINTGIAGNIALQGRSQKARRG